MQKKIKILFGILIIGLIAIGGWFITNLGEDTDSFTYVNDKLKNKLGEEVTSTGIARILKGYYIEHDSEDLDCLFIDDIGLIKIFSEGITMETTVKGIIERRVSDYGECTPFKQQCGKHLEYCINVKKIDYEGRWYYEQLPLLELPLLDDVDNITYDGLMIIDGEFTSLNIKTGMNKTNPNFKRLYSLLSTGINNRPPTIRHRMGAFDIIINLKSGQKITMNYFGNGLRDGEIYIKDQGIYLPNNNFYEFSTELLNSIEKIETVQKLNSLAFSFLEKNYIIALTGEIKEPEPYAIWDDYLFISFKDETGDAQLILKSTDKISLKKGQRICIMGKVVDYASAGFMVEYASVKILSE